MYSYDMSKQVKKPAKLLTLKEACEILKCHPNTLRAWDKNGYLTAVRLGSRRDRRYKREDIARLLKKRDNG